MNLNMNKLMNNKLINSYTTNLQNFTNKLIFNVLSILLHVL